MAIYAKRRIEPRGDIGITSELSRELGMRPILRGYSIAGSPPTLLFRTESPQLWFDLRDVEFLPHGWDPLAGGVLTVTLIPRSELGRSVRPRVTCCVLQR